MKETQDLAIHGDLNPEVIITVVEGTREEEVAVVGTVAAMWW
jgi:hypothetical protein